MRIWRHASRRRDARAVRAVQVCGGGVGVPRRRGVQDQGDVRAGVHDEDVHRRLRRGQPGRGDVRPCVVRGRAGLRHELGACQRGAAGMNEQ